MFLLHNRIIKKKKILGMLVFSVIVADSSADTPSINEQVIDLVNQERWLNGQLPPLKSNPILENVALQHSTDMAMRDFFSHCDPDTGTLPWDRMKTAGYNYNTALENIAAGFRTPDAVVTAWMNSPGHRKNILSTTAREIGIGYYFEKDDISNIRTDADSNCVVNEIDKGPYFHYWTQDFGMIKNDYPIVINREAHQSQTRYVDLYLYGSGWAQEMRIRNNDETWSDWQPFVKDVQWLLSPAAGNVNVDVELRNGAIVRQASDDIALDGTIDVAVTLQSELNSTAQELSYTAYITNFSSIDANDVTISDQLPDEVLFKSASTNCSLLDKTVTCTIDKLAAGNVQSVDIIVTPNVSASNNTISNSVNVSAIEGDTDITNNHDVEQTTIVTVIACEGDFDLDGDVDGSDLSVFSGEFGRTDCSGDLACSADFDIDGDVDGSDLSVFSTNFGKTDCPIPAP